MPLDNNMPRWMQLNTSEPAPVLFLDIRGVNADLNDPATTSRINARLKEMLGAAAPNVIEAPALIKTHIGEPKAWQRINPDLTISSIEFLRGSGIDKIVVGDSTVLYSRSRGGKENPPDNVGPYMELACANGWLNLGVPFVVLDRPISSVPGVCEFSSESVGISTSPPNRFKTIYVCGAVPVMGAIINHVHLTGHGLVGLALAMKGISMGFGDRKGKSQMHMVLCPIFDNAACDRCGICATECPENALEYPNDDPPKLIEEKCIGCSQCLSECPSGAIEMKPRGVTQWLQGQNTILSRMADFFIGIMNGRWDRTVHVAHLVKITVGCDCLNWEQRRMSPDIGFLVGKNPFAVDKAAELLLEETSPNDPDVRKLLDQSRRGDVYGYVEKTHGISTRPEIRPVAW